MISDFPEPPKEADKMNRFAQDYMQHLFPYGEDGVCHTAFGDLAYTVEVDEKSELHLSMNLKTFPEGCEEGFYDIGMKVPEGGEEASMRLYEINNGEIKLSKEAEVKSTLEVLNLIDAARAAILGHGWGMRKDYEEYLREQEEERNPSLRIMKEVANETMRKIYGKRKVLKRKRQ